MLHFQFSAVRVARVSLCGQSHLGNKQLWFGLLAALLFAVHPVHTETVSGLVCLSELISTACGLVAFLLWSKAHQMLLAHKSLWHLVLSICSILLLVRT
jgi:hypothetical protein